MKKLFLILVLFISGCTSTGESTAKVSLEGKVIGSYVSTQTGLLKGTMLHITEQSELDKVSSVATGNPAMVLLSHPDEDLLSSFAGKNVQVSGTLRKQTVQPFRAEFLLDVEQISER